MCNVLCSLIFDKQLFLLRQSKMRLASVSRAVIINLEHAINSRVTW